jgi:hypothetical protein
MGRVLYAYSNSTSVVSMRVFRNTTGVQLSVNDVSGYIPGPWSMPLFNDGPYRIELYDAVNGQKASPSSPVPSAVCTVMG